MDTFGEWLLSELDERDMSQSELSRVAGLSPGTISNILSGTRGRGTESLTKIARALKIPLDLVYQKAGLLPVEKKISKETAQILHELEDLTKEEQLEFLSYIRWRNNQSKK